MSQLTQENLDHLNDLRSRVLSNQAVSEAELKDAVQKLISERLNFLQTEKKKPASKAKKVDLDDLL
jgi:hypothetical protein